jgi:citrate synthase
VTQTQTAKGLEGVIALSTSVSHVYGEEGKLVYRGYDISELADNASFEEVAYLLWEGSLPTAQQLDALRNELASNRNLTSRAAAILEAMPNEALPMDVLRTVVSALSAEHAVAKSQSGAEAKRAAIALTAVFPTILAVFNRKRNGESPLPPRTDLSQSANYLYMLTGQVPSDVDAKALDVYFILLADHGMNASTFTTRVIASTESDMASAVIGGVGALKGPLHGGAPSLVLDMLDAIGTPDRTEKWMRDALGRGDRLMGFGHRVYKAEDPRAEILRGLASEMDKSELYALAHTAEQTGLRLLEEQKPGRRLYTNVEFYSSVVLNAVGLPRDMFTATFAASRVAGWTAHILEQYSDNRLIRPQSQYTGPTGLRFLPASER